MHLFRDILDKQLLDREEQEIGRVDGIVAELNSGAPPVITDMVLGAVPLARRFGRRAERWIEKLHARWSVRRSARFHIPWSKVMETHHRHIIVDLEVKETAAYDWERWLRAHVIGMIPGSGRK